MNAAARIAGLRQQCGGPRDGALLRHALGAALLDADLAAEACVELRRAVAFDPAYSAAWKLLGKACLAAADPAGAMDAWRQGIDVAQARGDVQAAKEMTVFLRRAQRSGPPED